MPVSGSTCRMDKYLMYDVRNKPKESTAACAEAEGQVQGNVGQKVRRSQRTSCQHWMLRQGKVEGSYRSHPKRSSLKVVAIIGGHRFRVLIEGQTADPC